MPQIDCAYFGRLSYASESVIEFPAGLPGFEDRRRFVPVELAEYQPLVFLQCVEPGGPCFPALPVQVIDPAYRLEVAPEDLALVGFACRRQPTLGREALALAVLTVAETGVTANLLAPVVINLANRKAVQAIQPERCYSHAHPLEAPESAGVAACS